jgi:putative peptidoglycan lipid II flippase
LPKWYGFDDDLRAVVREYWPALAGALLLSSTVVVDSAVAATRGAGSVSALNYGGKAVGFIVGTASLAIGTVVLPHFSELVAARQWQTIRSHVRHYSYAIMALSVPLMGILIALSPFLVRLFFQRGAFTHADSRLVARIQVAYLFQIPFYLVGTLGVRVLSSLRGNRGLIPIAVIGVAVNTATDIWFLHIWGIPGIALSTSVVYVCSALTIFLLMYRALRRHEGRAESVVVA